MDSQCCTGCGQEKPLDAFYRDRSTRSGRRAKCKVCDSAHIAAVKAADPERFRMKFRRYVDAHKDLVNTRRQKWNDTHREEIAAYRRQYNATRHDPFKAKARNKLRYAIRIGRIRRQPCQECGAAKAQGHHPDYSKPYDVKWLCLPCHSKEHAKVRNLPRYPHAAAEGGTR